MTTEEFQAEAQRIRPHLLTIARRYIDTPDEAEDIVQDGLLRLWQMLDELRLPIDSFAATVVRNLAIDHRRRLQPHEPITTQTADEGEATCQEAIDRMMNIINALPTFQQTILRLRHIEGMEFKHIAQMAGTTEGAVQMALSRARRTVFQQYHQQRNEE